VRIALFALIALNLAFFAWASWLAPEKAAMPVSPKVDAPRLQLANDASPVRAGGGTCVTVGPFASMESAARARATLTDSGYPSLPREEKTNAIDGFWVYLEAPSTVAAERRLIERLKKGGIDDAAAVGDPGEPRRISLGIFSEEARAAAQSERVAKLQLLPQIEARETQGSAIWLDLTLKSDAPPLEGQKFPAGDAELEFRACPPKPVAEGTSADAPVAESPPAQ
jgi:hypothetical protein